MSHHTSDPICPSCSEKLLLAHPILQDWFKNQIKPSFPNAHISWSYRGKEEQEQAYFDKRSKLHFPYSAHNKTPAMALDLFEILESGEGAWNPGFFVAINQYNLDHHIDLKWGAHFRLLGDVDHFALDDKPGPQAIIPPK